MREYKVVEKFVSINGEAQCAGELACFVRFAGCNLNCSYCDTKWANEQNVPYECMTAEDLLTYIRETGVKNVTLTGGEPLIQDGMAELIQMLAADKKLRIEIETNGSVFIQPFRREETNILFTLDYKLPGSGMDSFMNTDNYNLLKEGDTVKFVVAKQQDLEEARRIIDTYRLTERAKVYLSSSFSDIEPKEIVLYMIQNHMTDVRVQLQMHKYIWEPDKKGV